MSSYPMQRGPGQFASPFCTFCPGQDGCELCMISYFFPCVQYAFNTERLLPEDVLCGARGLPGGLLYLGLTLAAPVVTCGTVPVCFQWIAHMQARKAIRYKYNLQPEPCNDCCTVFFCPACALCQEHYQLTGPHNAGRYPSQPPHPGGPAAPPQYQPVSMGMDVPGGVVEGTPVGPAPGAYVPPAPGSLAHELPSEPLLKQPGASVMTKDPKA